MKRFYALALSATLALGSFVPAFAADTKKADGVKQNVVFINGYPDKTFRGNDNITRAEVAKAVASALGLAQQNANFSDTQGHWANGYIGALSAYLKGYGDGTFKPEARMTRAEVATLLTRVYKGEASKNVNFTDITGHWAEAEIKKLAAAGIIEGYGDGTFRPEGLVTRAEVVKMVLGVQGLKVDEDIEFKVPIPFSDVKKADWFVEEVLTASVPVNYTLDAQGRMVVQLPEDIDEAKSVKLNDLVFDSKDGKDIFVPVYLNGGVRAVDYVQAISNGITFEFSGENENKESLFAGEHGVKTGKLDRSKFEAYKEYTVKIVVKQYGRYVGTAEAKVQYVPGVSNNVQSLSNKVTFAQNGAELNGSVFSLKTKLINGRNDIAPRNEQDLVTVAKLIANVNNKEYDFIANGNTDYRVSSENEDILAVENDAQGKFAGLRPLAGGKTKVTFQYGNHKVTIDVEVKVGNRRATKVEFKPEAFSVVNGYDGRVKFQLTDNYGDPVAAKTVDAATKAVTMTKTGDSFTFETRSGELVALEQVNSEFKSLVEYSDLKDLGNGEFVVKVTGKNVGIGATLVQIADLKDATKNNTIGKQKVEVVDSAKYQPASYKLVDGEGLIVSSPVKLVQGDDKKGSIDLQVAQYTAHGSFYGNAELGAASSDDKTIADVKVEGNKAVVTAKAAGTTFVNIQAKNGAQLARVKVVVEGQEATTLTQVTYKSKENRNELGTYKVKDFLDADSFKVNKATLNKVTLDEDGTLKIDGVEVGKLEVFVSKEGSKREAKKFAAGFETVVVDAQAGEKYQVEFRIMETTLRNIDKTFNIDVPAASVAQPAESK